MVEPSHGAPMRQRVDAHDWSTTVLGPRASWPAALACAAELVLDNACPMYLAWGEPAVALYNDAFAPLLGDAHPAALGAAPAQAFAHARAAVEPLFDEARAGRAIAQDEVQLDVAHGGAREHRWLDLTCSPVAGGGALLTANEATAHVLAARRWAIRDALSVRLRTCRTYDDVIAAALAVLGEHPADVPLVLCYAIDPDARRAHLAGAVGPALARYTPPRSVALGRDGTWAALDEAARTGMVGKSGSDAGPMILVPTGDGPGAIVLAYLPDPHLRFDGDHGWFIERIAAVLGAAILRVAHALASAVAPASRDDLLSSLEYELRNPLAPIASALELMRRRGDRDVGRERAVIERQVKHLRAVLDDLLDMSQLEHGTVVLARAPIELAEVVARAVALLRPRLLERHLDVRLEVPLRGLLVDGDQERLVQAVAHLVGGSIRTTHRGGWIRLRGKRAGGSVSLTVEDGGAGFTGTAAQAVFPPSADAPVGREAVGLAASIARSVIEQHGGKVIAMRDRGRSRDLRIELPGAPAAPPDEPPEDDGPDEEVG